MHCALAGSKYTYDKVELKGVVFTYRCVLCTE